MPRHAGEFALVAGLNVGFVNYLWRPVVLFNSQDKMALVNGIPTSVGCEMKPSTKYTRERHRTYVSAPPQLLPAPAVQA